MEQLSLLGPTARLCVDCGKPARKKAGVTGYQPKRCELCHKAAKLKSDRDSKTKARAVRAIAETPEERAKRLEYHKNYNEKNRPNWSVYHWHHRLSRYGLTEACFKRMWKEQEGCCAICGVAMQLKAPKRSADECVIDHDHSLGHVRGLLCRGCNAGLGFFENKPGSLEAAIRYLSASTVGAATRAAA